MKDVDLYLKVRHAVRIEGLSERAAARRFQSLIRPTIEAVYFADQMSLPLLDFAGSPTGIDLRKVVDSCIRPVLTTGIAHKEAGVGQIGAGIVRAPMGCFVKALAGLAAALGATDLGIDQLAYEARPEQF